MDSWFKYSILELLTQKLFLPQGKNFHMIYQYQTTNICINEDIQTTVSDVWSCQLRRISVGWLFSEIEKKNHIFINLNKQIQKFITKSLLINENKRDYIKMYIINSINMDVLNITSMSINYRNFLWWQLCCLL